MKRVLIFSLAYAPYIGGAEVAIKEITDRISPEEIEFHLLTLRFDSTLPKEERIGNVMVHRIGKGGAHPSMSDLQKPQFKRMKYWFQFAAAFYVMRLHKTQKFDAIWAMMAHSCAIPAGIFKSFYPDVKYLLTLQEGDPPAQIERQMRPVWPFFKQGFTKADALQPISTFLLEWGKRMGFRGSAKVIPNGVDTKRFLSATLSSHERDIARAKMQFRPSDVVLVTTSRLVYKNGIDTVLHALALLPENVYFVIYGAGPEVAKLHALTAALKLNGRVRFMGELAYADIPSALAVADIFIRPSRSEGMGNSFIEAMAAGVPVIATQVGGIADFLFDAKRNQGTQPTGFAVDVDSPEQIRDAVNYLTSHKAEVAQVTATAKELVTQKYDWNLIAADMRQLFTGLFQTA